MMVDVIVKSKKDALPKLLCLENAVTMLNFQIKKGLTTSFVCLGSLQVPKFQFEVV